MSETRDIVLQKRKPQRLRTNEEHLRAFVDQAPVPIAMFDHDLHYVAASHQWVVDFCGGRSDVVGKSMYAVIPEIPQHWRNVHQRALAGETVRDDEIPFRRSRGRMQWIGREVRPWRRVDGEIGGIIIFARDVTSAVVNKNILQNREFELRETQRLAKIGSWWWDAKTRIASESDELARIFGFDPTIDTFPSFKEQRGLCYPAAEWERISAAGRKTFKTGIGFELEVQAYRKGIPIWVSTRGEAMRNAVGRIVGLRGAVQDITAGKQAEAALRESEERLRLAVEAGRLATWDWNIVSSEVTWNDEHYRILGYEVGEVNPSYDAWAARLYADDRPKAEAKLKDAIVRQDEYWHEYRVVRPDGAVRWCAGRGRIVHDSARRAVRMIGLLEDITERRQWEEAQRILVAELQHRTRNLMAVVQSIAHQTMNTAKTTEAFRDGFDDRLDALSRVQNLLSRTGEDPVTVGELVRMELEALAAGSYEAKVALKGPRIRVRRGAVQMLALAVHELATNARKYGALSRDHGRLSVTWRHEPSENGRRWLTLEWNEVGLARGAESLNWGRSGYGRRLIEQALPYSLSARTKFEMGDDSLHCSLSLPLAVRGHEEVVG